MSNYDGRCPLCSGQLTATDNGTLVCSDGKGHYMTFRKEFERLWSNYELKRSMSDPTTKDDAVKLLRSLRMINMIVDPPTISKEDLPEII